MRINVTGNAGSGKSTLARRIAEEMTLPLIEMDRIIWKSGWQKVSPALARQQLSEKLAQDNWVLDGVSKVARQQADLIVFLDFSRSLCAWRCCKRNWRYLFHSRPGLPEGCPEWKIIPTLAQIIWNFPTQARPIILKDMTETPETGVVIQSRADLAKFTHSLPSLHPV